MAHYLDALENAIRDHRVTGYRPTDTTDIYRAIGTLGVIVQTLSHLIFQVKLGIAELPAADEGLRTDTIAGDLDPDATAAAVAVSLTEARRDIDSTGTHLRNAPNNAARLYV